MLFSIQASRFLSPLLSLPILGVVKVFASGVFGGLLMLLALGIWFLNDKPELSIWHTASFDEEFTRQSKVTRFEEYLKLEDRLFRQLEREVYDQIEERDKIGINRYFRGSISDPGRWEKDWNRSFEMKQDAPVAGVLVLHGLTDSPYSMRHVSKTLNEHGAYVLALRVPGHGTAPSSLANVSWRDMEAAVKLAARHVAEKAPGVPFYIVGYSNGGALAVRYAISSVEDSEGLAKVDGMVLFSPEIGVAKTAGLAIWQERIGRFLNLKKLRWTGLAVEYDPFKYNSFPVNGGILAHDLTKANRSEMARLAEEKKLEGFPSTLAFQSAVDATVIAPDLVRDFFFHLPPAKHELVIYDLNRIAGVEPLLKVDPKENFATIVESPARKFAITVLTNTDDRQETVDALTWLPGELKSTTYSTGLSWPRDIYSLSHVALPFPGNDPLYGGLNPDESPGVHLGTVAHRGEKGALKISAKDMLRLRWNPFYDYQEKRILEHLGLDPP